MVTFLTDEWVEALDAAARTHEVADALPAGGSLVVQQTVTNLADGGSFTYHVTFDPDGIRVLSGPAPEATISFSQDLATAVGIATGRGSAQGAFMSGRLKVGGDLSVLTANGAAFAELSDVFAAIRHETELPDPPEHDGDA